MYFWKYHSTAAARAQVTARRRALPRTAHLPSRLAPQRTPHRAARPAAVGSGFLLAGSRARRRARSLTAGTTEGAPCGAVAAAPLKTKGHLPGRQRGGLRSAAGSKRRAHGAQQRGPRAGRRVSCGQRAPRPPRDPAHRSGPPPSRGTPPPAPIRPASTPTPRLQRLSAVPRGASRPQGAVKKRREVQEQESASGGTPTWPSGRVHTQTPSGRGALPRASVFWGSLRAVPPPSPDSRGSLGSPGVRRAHAHLRPRRPAQPAAL